MILFDELKVKLSQIQPQLQNLKEALHIPRLQDEKSELEAISSEPDFWLNPEKAKEVQTRMGAISKKLQAFEAMLQLKEDIEVLVELGTEAEDESLAKEAEQHFSKLLENLEKMRLQTLLVGEYDQRNAMLTLHAGAGGTEAQDWVSMLYRMYLRFAEKQGFEVKLTDLLDGDEAGIKSVSFMVKGENAYGFLRSEMGVHRLVRISPFDSSGRRHTSFASVEVMPELDESFQIEIRAEDLRIDTFRSSGAGGQHVNKTESAVRITHIPTGLVTSCQTERSQPQNKETAMNMLKSKLFALAKAAHMDKIEDLKGKTMEIAWGSQIRSYVFCPYTMVKDHRSNHEKVDVEAVMDGEIDGFINAYLSMPSNAAER